MRVNNDIDIPVIKNDTVSISYSIITCELGIRHNDKNLDQFISKDLGTFSVISATSIRTAALIARLKEVYPELNNYKNIVILERTSKNFVHKFPTEELLEKLDIQIEKVGI